MSEGSGNVTVCVEMTGIPADGLGHDVSVSFNAMSGPRAGTIIILVTQEPYSHRFVCMWCCKHKNDALLVVESGVDFSPMDLVVTFTSGTTGSVNVQCISIGITDDDDYEEDQQFEVEIASVLPDTTAIGTGAVVITIQDNNGRGMNVSRERMVNHHYSRVLWSPDAVVQLNESALIVDEEEGSVYICVDSGITGNVETLLNVVLTSYSDKASECSYSDLMSILISILQSLMVPATVCILFFFSCPWRLHSPQPILSSVSSRYQRHNCLLLCVCYE